MCRGAGAVASGGKGIQNVWDGTGTGWASVLEAGPRWRRPTSGRRLAAQAGSLRLRLRLPRKRQGEDPDTQAQSVKPSARKTWRLE